MTDNNSNIIEEIRKAMYGLVDQCINALSIAYEQQYSNPSNKVTDKPLNMMSAYFKGRKPLELRLPSGDIIPVKTWKNVAQIILDDCNADSERHEILMQLRQVTSGRDRKILSNTPKGMDSPLKIDDNLYFESKFDTESLLNVLKGKVLNPTGYDTRNVYIRSHKPTPQYVLDNEVNNETALSTEQDCVEEDEDEGFQMGM